VTGARDDAWRAAEAAARSAYGRLVAILAARSRDIAASEDALSDALAAALATWPERGVPANPAAWLFTTARNRIRNGARHGRVRDAAIPESERRLARTEAEHEVPDERLRLMFVCAHTAIDPAARAPLILQTVLGLDAARIAEAFLVPPATMSQRLVRAKARIRDAGIRFALPERADLASRLDAVLDAIYAAFSRGWEGMERPDAPAALTGEAIWLARLLVALLPEEPEPKGLLALMLYCAARQAARRDLEGRFVPLDCQEGRLWNRTMIIEAEGLLVAAARAGRFGRFQCEAAIQSVHVQRPITGRTNYAALRRLYDLLVTHDGSLGARIGRALVLAEAGDPAGALAALDALPEDRVAPHQPYWVARARVLEVGGCGPGAADALTRALALTGDEAVRRHLCDWLGRVGPEGHQAVPA
jgi:RNA polymerase sigma-70 factor, ECF subfamily